jgi:hypothetical protein
MRKWIVGLVMAFSVVVLVVSGASAQFLPGIAEMTGFGGATFNSEDETTAGAALTINLTPRLGVEGEIGMIFTTDEIVTVNGSLIANLGSGTSVLVPYLIGGAGILNNGGTDIALNLGAGIKLFVEPRLALRVDFRSFLTSENGDIHDMQRIYAGLDFLF